MQGTVAEPLLDAHDRSQFEVTLYANVRRGDEVTTRLQGKCDRWRDIEAGQAAGCATILIDGQTAQELSGGRWNSALRLSA